MEMPVPAKAYPEPEPNDELRYSTEFYDEAYDNNQGYEPEDIIQEIPIARGWLTRAFPETNDEAYNSNQRHYGGPSYDNENPRLTSTSYYDDY